MNDITGLILTFNEAPNIARTLGQLSWLRDIVDRRQPEHGWHAPRSRPPSRTCESFKRIFTTHAEQWNFGLEQTGIATEWVLALDADYVLTDDLSRELQALQPDPPVSRVRGVIRLLHRRAAAARRRLSAGHGSLSARARPLRTGWTYATRAARRRGAAARRAHSARRPQVTQSLARSTGRLHGARSRQTRWSHGEGRWAWPIAYANGS